MVTKMVPQNVFWGSGYIRRLGKRKELWIISKVVIYLPALLVHFCACV